MILPFCFSMLLDVTKNHIKISDFGITKLLIQKDLNFMERLKKSMLGNEELEDDMDIMSSGGTDGYSAPEMSSGASYTVQVDVFSMGRSIWSMIYRRLIKKSLC